MKAIILSILTLGSLANSSSAQNCISVAGNWCGTERATITIRVGGDTETEHPSGYGCLNISQSGCTITFYSGGLVGGSTVQLKRTGPVQCNTFTVTGQLSPNSISGYSVKFSENWIRGTGVVVGNSLTITTVGRAVGKLEGVSFTIDASSTGTYTDNRTAAPPTFTTHPASMIGALGGTATFQVAATGICVSRYQWFRNGVKISGATNATLTLNNLQFSDAGQYWATAVNFDGSRTSRTAQLGVVDRTPPVLSFTFPTEGLRLTNQSHLQVRGRSSDNVGVTAVRLQVNDGDFLDVPGAAGTNKWAVTVPLKARRNTLRAFALDSAGNRSATNTLRCYHVVAEPITLRSDPSNGGNMTGVNDQQMLEIGKTFTVTAVPAPNFLFAGWTGSHVSSNSVLSFTMAGGTVLQANFVTNRFLAVRGTYQGLFGPTNVSGALDFSQAHPTNAGLATLTLSKTGAVTGKIYLAGVNHDFAGQSDLSGHVQVAVPRPGRPSLNLHLWFDLPEPPSAEASQQLRGILSDGSWSAGLTGHRTKLFQGASNYFTFIVPSPGEAPEANRPGGDGAGSLTVTTNGIVALAGTLGDSTPFTLGAGLSREGDWPVFVPLYGGGGMLLGWGRVSTQHAPLGVKADLLWFKPPGQPGKRYPSGFAERVELQGAIYTKPPRQSTPLNWTNGTVRLDGGHLASTLVYDVTWVSNKLVVLTSTNNLWLTNALKPGLFGGMFRHPATGNSIPFAGAYLRLPEPEMGWGGGWFRGTNETGYVEIVPQGSDAQTLRVWPSEPGPQPHPPLPPTGLSPFMDQPR